MTDEKSISLPLEMQRLYQAFDVADSVVLRKYVTTLEKAPCIKMDATVKSLPVGDNTALYRIAQIVYDKNENIQEKLTTVYSTILPMANSGLAVLLCGHPDHVDLFFGVVARNYQKKEDGTLFVDSKKVAGQSATIRDAFLGNFPGSVVKTVNNEANKKDIYPLIDQKSKADIIRDAFKKTSFIAAVSSVPAVRGNHTDDRNVAFVQGLEKFIDTMHGKEYTVLLLADAVSNEEIESLCSNYEDLYSQLVPFRSSVYTFNNQNSVTDTESFVRGTVETTNRSIARAMTHGTSFSKGHTDTVGGSAYGGVNVGVQAGGGVTYNHGYTRTRTTSDSQTKTEAQGTAHSRSEQNSVAKALSTSQGESVQLNYENRAVQTLLDRLDEQIKRMRSCEDFGLFNACAYFAASTYDVAVSAASVFRSITRGDNSSVEASAINVWKNREDIRHIEDYLQRFTHPEFMLCLDKEHSYPTTAAMLVSGKEMAYQMPLPKKSVPGISVISCAEFGRNVISYDLSVPRGQSIELGNIFHMNRVEDANVCLSTQSITSHIFITGSTGTGKSNTVYQILQNALSRDIPFLVVEPAKGEYKHVFGSQKNVYVYGTNPQMMPLLQINPFRFPKEIHVLEHLDRLVELFNVCWPMYAAMPAVLKSAVERAYEDCGWDLISSSNPYSEEIYPSFSDVARNIRTIIDESEYDTENKGAYKGSLLTRLESLTTGLNGMIFSCDDCADKDLFERNVIVDLSRVGSSETKSLIMGMLVLKLQEHRMTTCTSINAELKHITVLEEAHNLLKRTSTEYSSETANLTGKSVEMLTNAIAEMRTYGEGFIIADQAPGLLDPAVIRNTNTKIILRLPDYADRELVGRAANLNEDQIAELAKLPRGVAAVYQNEWIQPVLCQVKYFQVSSGLYTFLPPDKKVNNNRAVEQVLLHSIMNKAIFLKEDKTELRNLKTDILRSNLDGIVKRDFMEYISSTGEKEERAVERLVYDFLGAKQAIQSAAVCGEIKEWGYSVVQHLRPSIESYSKKQIDLALNWIICEQVRRDPAYNNIARCAEESYKTRGGVL